MKRDHSSYTISAVYWLLVLAILLLALIGYGSYVIYPRFDLPVVLGVNLFLLATAAGAAAFFSPCSFPLLATLLAREVTVDDRPSLRQAWRYGAALSVGVFTFLLLTGSGLALGLGSFFAEVTFTSPAGRMLRTVVGLILIVFGVFQATGRSVTIPVVERVVTPLMRRQARLRRDRPWWGFFLFGFGYVLAGFG